MSHVSLTEAGGTSTGVCQADSTQDSCILQALQPAVVPHPSCPKWTLASCQRHALVRPVC